MYWKLLNAFAAGSKKLHISDTSDTPVLTSTTAQLLHSYLFICRVQLADSDGHLLE